MAFVVPTFNSSVNVWHAPNFPPALPDATPACQLRAPGRQSIGLYSLTPQPAPLVPLWELLVPAGEDLRDPYNGTGGTWDLVEVPPASGRYYYVTLVDDAAKGFTNEYRIAFIGKTTDAGVWPVPIP